MQDIDVGEKALASYVALRIDDVAIKQGCVGWIATSSILSAT